MIKQMLSFSFKRWEFGYQPCELVNSNTMQALLVRKIYSSHFYVAQSDLPLIQKD